MVAVLVALGLAVTAWWVVRSDAEPADDGELVAAPAGALVPLEPVSSDPGAGATVAAGDTGPPETVTVDVAGKVRRPGIAVLVDGEQILVGAPASQAATAGSVPAAGTSPTVLVNLNTADGSQLDTLPEVGPVTAASILAWRDAHGGFTSVDELLEVDGIGEATLAKIAPHVTV